MMKFFYVSFESIFDHIFDSQVLIFLKKIEEKLKPSETLTFINFCSLQDFFKKNYFKKIKEIRNFLGIRCLFSFKFPYSKKMPVFFKLMVFLNSIIVFLVLIFSARLKKNEKAVLHCRTDIGAYILLTVKKLYYSNIKIICDCRGLGSKEVLYGSKGEALSKKIEEVENYAQKNADNIFCVSDNYKNYIASNNNLNKSKIETIPCCIDINKFRYDARLREEIRAEMGIMDKFVVLYSGSLNEWQLPKAMIEIFKIFDECIKDSIFVMYTNDLEKANNLFTNFNIKGSSYVIDSKPYGLINQYLSAGDVGLLIREDNDLNAVASPIKFAEYVGCGVPALSSIPGDTMDLIEKYNLGFKLEDLDDSGEIYKVVNYIKENIDYIKSDGYKNNISKIIKDKMGWEGHIEKALRVYRKLLS